MSPFAAGEACLLIDDEGRKFLLDLDPSRGFSTHRGSLPHTDIIGAPEGTRVVTGSGAGYVALRPRREDFVLKMKRGPQVVYPKDVGPILVHGDIRPGQTVLEAGTGSGSLTLALVDAVGERGRVVSVDRRDDHLRFATTTITRWFGGIPDNLELRAGDVEDVIAEVAPDRVVLDLPEPWHAIAAGAGSLTGGAVVVAYVPTVPQLEQTHHALTGHGFVDVTALEVWFREWHVEGRSVRPSHQMVGHTGFLVLGRKAL
jgi:tRNA (adenine57-N1/adenine58-N1)-methyltransferase catalytic subunit